MTYQKDYDPPQQWRWYAISLGKSWWTTHNNPNCSFSAHRRRCTIEVDEPDEEKSEDEVEEQIQGEKLEEEKEDEPQEEESEERIATKHSLGGRWMDPSNVEYRRGKWHAALLAEVKTVTEGPRWLENTETAMVLLAEDKPANYNEAIQPKNSETVEESP